MGKRRAGHRRIDRGRLLWRYLRPGILWWAGAALALVLLWHFARITPVWWCVLVGFVVAVVVWVVVRYIIALPPGMPPWFRLKNENAERPIHRVRVLLNQEPVVDNPPEPHPLEAGPIHGQPMFQIAPTPKLKFAIWLQPNNPEPDISKETDSGADAHYDLIDLVALPDGHLWVYAQWREQDEVHWFEETL